MTGGNATIEATTALVRELVDGVMGDAGWILNPGDAGLLRSLGGLTAERASAPGRTGSTVASHVAHVLYGLELLNRWSHGENPFTADYAASWHRREVTEAEWSSLRKRLEAELRTWTDTLAGSQALGDAELKGKLASLAHLAYHLGAMRQIAPDARGPKADEASERTGA
jgi:hypothetical protein